MGPLSRQAGLDRRARAVLALCVLGGFLRVLAVFFDRPLHPDEFFQYLEPAYTHLTGVGLEAWEFRDGLRSWVLPFYHGAWLAALMAVGVSKGTLLLRVIQVQSALVNASLVWIAYRAGASVTRKLTGASAREAWAGFSGGAFAAFLCATFPLLVFYAGHTLSEQPSLLLLCLGLVELCELSEEDRAPTRRTQKKAALAGLFLSCAACLRIANGPLVLIAPVWLLLTRRNREFVVLAVSALLPALVFGLVDLLTWGAFAHSYVAYVKFNFIDGKASNFGTAPALFYLESLWQRAPFTAPLLLVVACFGVRRSYMFMLPLLLGLLYLSAQPHKEERFVLFVWPLLFITAGAVLGAARARLLGGQILRPWYYRALPFVLALAIPIDGALHAADRSWLTIGRFRAESAVAEDPTLTGMMIDAPIFAGGALWLGVRAPHFDFAKGVLPNPLITHVVVEVDSKQRDQAEAAGFKPIRYLNDLVILRRLPAQR
jgi:GPI mannosyltransferase 3